MKKSGNLWDEQLWARKILNLLGAKFLPKYRAHFSKRGFPKEDTQIK